MRIISWPFHGGLIRLRDAVYRPYRHRRVHMRVARSAVAALVLGASIASSSPGATSAATTVRHDGTIEAVDARTHTIVIRELRAGGGASDVRIHLAPHAPVVRSERNVHVMDARHEFTTTPILLSTLRRGDFVVVDVTGRGAHARGESVTATLRAGA
jgi:hypothetical protein